MAYSYQKGWRCIIDVLCPQDILHVEMGQIVTFWGIEVYFYCNIRYIVTGISAAVLCLQIDEHFIPASPTSKKIINFERLYLGNYWVYRDSCSLIL